MIEFHYSVITGLVWYDIREPYIDYKSKKRKKNQ